MKVLRGGLVQTGSHDRFDALGQVGALVARYSGPHRLDRQARARSVDSSVPGEHSPRRKLGVRAGVRAGMRACVWYDRTIHLFQRMHACMHAASMDVDCAHAHTHTTASHASASTHMMHARMGEQLERLREQYIAS